MTATLVESVTADSIAALQQQLLAAQRLYASEQGRRHQPHPDAQPAEVLKAIRAVVTSMATTAQAQGLAVYLRISDDRAGAGLGVKRQMFDIQPLIDELVLLLGIVGPVHLYVDNDLTASGKKKRPAYQQMLTDMAAGKVRALVAWHPDRIYRNPTELEALIKLVDEQGVAIKTAKHGELDLSTPTGRLLARLLGGVAMYELEHQIERGQAKKAELAREGKTNGGPRLFGYTAGFKVDPETGTCVVLAEKLAAQTVVGNLLAGASLRSQAAWLNAQDESALHDKRQPMLGTRGSLWNPTSLRAYVLRPSITGVRVHKAGTPDEQRVKAQWPGLITEEQHQRLAALLEAPDRKTTSGHNARRHLLTGLARCGVCDGVMAAATARDKKGGPRYLVYRCKARYCVHRKGDRLEAITLHLVGAWLAKQAPTGLLNDPSTDSAMQALDLRLAEVQRLLKRIESDYDAELLTGLERKQKKEPLVAELALVERERLSLQAPATVLDGLWGHEDATELLKALPLARKRAVISAVGVPVAQKGMRQMDDFSVLTMRWHKRPQL